MNLPLQRLRVFCSLALAALCGGTGCVGVSADDPPAAAGEVIEGQRLVLRAEVEGGEPPFHYLWFKDYSPLVTQTNAELVFESIKSSDAGTYWVTVFNDGGSTTSAPEVITVRRGRASRLTNVSIVGAANDRVVVGFTLGGAGATGTTEVLARAAGPALMQFGVLDALRDPVLRIFQQQRLLSSNDDWGGDVVLAAAALHVGAFPFPNPSKDAAMLLSLPSSSYSAEVADGGNANGITALELYDTGSESERATPRLLNISARGMTGIDGAPLTAGFVIQGDATVTVLLRAVGPSLERFGLTGVARDPRLSLFRGPALVSANENWGDDSPATIEAAQAGVGAFSLDAKSLDAALLIALRPGTYTAQVSNPSEAGLAMIEVYEVQ